MGTLMNPVHKLGEKNIYCPHYRTCLDHAVKNSWDSWICDNCDYKSIKAPLTGIQYWQDDGTPYYVLGRP